MAPLGGRRDKQIARDFFKMWKEYIEEVLGEKKQQDLVKDYFRLVFMPDPCRMSLSVMSALIHDLLATA